MIDAILDALFVDLDAPVAIDIESTGTRLYQGDVLRGFAVTVNDESWYVPVSHPGSDNVPAQEARRVVQAVAQHSVVCMHNGPFDRAGLALTFGVEFEDLQDWDTMTVDWLINENLSHALKEIGARLFGADAKAEKKALDALKHGRTVDEVYRELRDVENLRPRADRESAVLTRQRAREIAAGTHKDWDTFTADDIAAYAMQDTRLTLDLHEWQQDFLAENPEYSEGIEREQRVAGLAYRMTRTGVRVDRDRAVAALEAAETRAAELQAGFPVNLKSPQQVAKLLYEDWKLPVSRRTRSGAPSTDKLALKGLSYDERVNGLLEFRSLTKQIDAFYIPLLDRVGDDGRIHPSWNCHRVVTGRWSCSEPNLQQIPRDGSVKTVFIPEPGYTFVHADLPNAELRVAAILADEDIWLDAFAAGADLHQTMADAAGVPRQVAKTINFSALYGVGPRKLAQTLAQGTGQRPDENLARRMLNSYWAAVPRVRRLFDGMAEAWVRRGRLPIRPWSGRFRHREGRFGPESDYKALNSIIQGSVGESVKDWLLELEIVCRNRGWRLVAQVHDAVTLEVPESDYAAAAAALQVTWDDINPFDRLPWVLDCEEVF